MSDLRLLAASRHYPGPPQVTALRDVDLYIPAGQYCAVRGTSGSGKSTLLNILGLLDRADDGRYLIGGDDVSGLPEAALDRLRASVFGFVFQSAHMVPQWTVAANVALGLRAQHVPRQRRAAAVRDVLDVVGLLHRARATARDLSGGERQRAAIARALCTRPAVILADEPTGNLDSVNTEAVLDLFDVIHRTGVSVVMITHDDRVAARASRQIDVRDGRIVADAARTGG